ncbi:MAG: zinc ribbon domain-containing protein [Leptospirales bacterium]
MCAQEFLGGLIRIVDPRNTSRQCSCCGCIDKKNRKSQSEFVCTQCHFSCNADFNAAINIASRAKSTGLLRSEFNA